MVKCHKLVGFIFDVSFSLVNCQSIKKWHLIEGLKHLFHLTSGFRQSYIILYRREDEKFTSIIVGIYSVRLFIG